MPPPRANPLSRLAAKMRLSSALKSADPPADDHLLPLYVETLLDGALDEPTRARICRAITYTDASAGRYVEAWIPLYIEAACAFSDDPRCVLYVLSLLYSGAINARAALPFAQGVYAAALFFDSWEGGAYHIAFGLPPYSELRHELALLYAADVSATAVPEHTALVESVYGGLKPRPDDPHWEDERAELAGYLARAYRIEGRDDAFAREVREDISRWHAAPVPGRQRDWNDDPLDDPEVILRGGSGDPEDDLRIARRYIEEQREFDSAACALFSRCVRHAKMRGNEAESSYWNVQLAHALIAVGRVDEDTTEILGAAAGASPDDSLLELAYLYSFARSGLLEQVAADSDLSRMEKVVLTQSREFEALAAERQWDWGVLQRSLALAWGHRGRTDAYARAFYKQVTEALPEDLLLAVLYARALAQAGITDRAAIPAYENVLEMGKANEPVRRVLAVAYAKAGAALDDEKRPKALLLWEEMHRSGLSDDPDVTAALAEAYSREGKSSDVALAVWEKAAQADPKNGAVRLRLARELRRRGDAMEAVRFYTEAAKLLPNDFGAQYEAGTLLRTRSDDAGAVRFLEKAVSLPEGASHKEAHFALGEALLATAKRDEAMQVFEKILSKLDPDHAPTLIQMAKLNLRYEETGAIRAEQLYGKAVSLDVANPEAYKRLALLHEELGRFDDAEAAWEQYLALSPADAESSRKIADLYLKRGDFVKAESALRQTVALGGGDKQLFNLLGEVILQAEKLRGGRSDALPPVAGAGFDETAAQTKTRRISPRPSAALTTGSRPKPDDVAPEAADSSAKRQTLLMQSSLPPATPAAPNPDSPASQNLTRSVGAAAIKAALRNRAARLTQAIAENSDD